LSQRIGILGGTFDPIHYGHLAIAEEVRWSLGLARVYVVPTAYQPLKQGRHAATPPQRLEMVRRACADNAALEPWDIEIRRPPPSYTVDTLQVVQERYGGNAEVWFILGADAVLRLPRWYRARQVLALARLALVARPGVAVDLAALEDEVPGISQRTEVITGPLLDIASSTLRERLAQGQPVRYQLPDAVLDYVREEGLYTL
jgi:nicotinate (nicotinamide) nucleotide adenylyltransferase